MKTAFYKADAHVIIGSIRQRSDSKSTLFLLTNIYDLYKCSIMASIKDLLLYFSILHELTRYYLKLLDQCNRHAGISAVA